LRTLHGGLRAHLDAGRADILETHYSPTCVIIPNFVALGPFGRINYGNPPGNFVPLSTAFQGHSRS